MLYNTITTKTKRLFGFYRKDENIMATTFSIVIIIEVLLTAFIAWGIMHEEKFVDFEDKLILAVRRKIRKEFAKREYARRAKLNEKVVYTPVRPERSQRATENSAA